MEGSRETRLYWERVTRTLFKNNLPAASLNLCSLLSTKQNEPCKILQKDPGIDSWTFTPREIKLTSTQKPVPGYSEHLFCNSPKLEATKMFYNMWMVEQWDIHCGILLNNEKDQTIDTTTWMDFKGIKFKWKNLKRPHIAWFHLRNYSYMKCAHGRKWMKCTWDLSARSLQLPASPYFKITSLEPVTHSK